MILSIIIIFIISIISIFCVLTGYLAWVLLFFILIISIIVSLITITFSTKRKINYILNYILLFFILSVLIGEVYVYHKNYSYEKELLQIAKIIEDYYYDTNKEYDSDEINKLLEENKMKRYRVEINENYFTISILTKNTGWIYGIGYNSEDKSIYKDYKK
jgi:ABC-type multidrug transport system permease subunit